MKAIQTKFREVQIIDADVFGNEPNIRWDDAAIRIDWALAGGPLASGRDGQSPSFLDSEYFD